MEINKSPKPIFDTDDDRTYFLVKLPLNEYFIEQKAQEKAQDETVENKVTVNINNFNNTELRLIEVLKGSNMSKKDIAIVLGYKSISGNLKKLSIICLSKG